MKKSSAVPFAEHVKLRLFFYLVTGLVSGFLLWMVEALDRFFVLRRNFVEPGESTLFLTFFVFTAVGGPLWGLFLAACSTVRAVVMNFVPEDRPLTVGKYVVPRLVRQLAVVAVGFGVFFILVSVVFPRYFIEPLLGMFAGATEKIRFFRTIFGHQKLSAVLLIAGLSVGFTLLEEVIDHLIARRNPDQPDRFGTLLGKYATFTPAVLGGLSVVVLAVCYWADATMLVTRRDLSFHVPMYLAALTASMLLAGVFWPFLTKSKPGFVVLSLIVVLTAGGFFVALSSFDSNQNLKSLFWRRGVIAKRYVGLWREVTAKEEKEFAALVASRPSGPPASHALDRSPESSEPIRPSLPALAPVTSFAPETESQTAVFGKPIGRRNVIFLSIDTLRADHMSVYGYGRRTTPNLDRFAGQSLFFEKSYSTGTNTGHSFSSILRSALGDGIFDGSVPTMAEVLKQHGYQTAFITSPKTKTWLYKGRWFEYKQIMMTGFDDVVHEEPRFWKAQEMTDKSIDMLKRLKDKGPFFAWIHYTDPHAPYENHAECGFGEGQDMNIYDSEIAYTDIHVGRLLAYLKESGLLENTIIAFTSDHGEGFGEHGAVEHGCLPYIEQNFVPIWVFTPDEQPKRLSTPVSHIDLAPTMLAFTGVQIPKEYEGIDLVKTAKGEVQPHQYVVTETPRNIPEGTFFAWALTEGDWKIIYDKVGSNWQLYDLKNDPTEQRNLADIEPAKFADLKTKLVAYFNRQAARKDYSNWRRFHYR